MRTGTGLRSRYLVSPATLESYKSVQPFIRDTKTQQKNTSLSTTARSD